MATYRLHPRSVYGYLVLAGALGLIAVVVTKWNLPAANLKTFLIAAVALLGIGLVGQLQRPVRIRMERAAAALRRS